jgi:hypothetical protein
MGAVHTCEPEAFQTGHINLTNWHLNIKSRPMNLYFVSLNTTGLVGCYLFLPFPTYNKSHAPNNFSITSLAVTIPNGSP